MHLNLQLPIHTPFIWKIWLATKFHGFGMHSGPWRCIAPAFISLWCGQWNVDGNIKAFDLWEILVRTLVELMAALVQTAIFFRNLFPLILLQKDWSSSLLKDSLFAPLSPSSSSLSAFCSSENLLKASMPIATRRLKIMYTIGQVLSNDFGPAQSISNCGRDQTALGKHFNVT